VWVREACVPPIWLHVEGKERMETPTNKPERLCYHCNERPLMEWGTSWCKECTVEGLARQIKYPNEALLAHSLRVFDGCPDIPVGLLSEMRQALQRIRDRKPKVVGRSDLR
jgi:hypothetical protein